jgi:membrane protein YdbS with pleckstrin-like domain
MLEDKQINVWNYKPWWCQPWSILLTTVTIISASWLIFKIIWLTIIIAIPILTWMIFFIFIYPKLITSSGILNSEELEIKN